MAVPVERNRRHSRRIGSAEAGITNGLDKPNSEADSEMHETARRGEYQPPTSLPPRNPSTPKSPHQNHTHNHTPAPTIHNPPYPRNKQNLPLIPLIQNLAPNPIPNPLLPGPPRIRQNNNNMRHNPRSDGSLQRNTRDRNSVYILRCHANRIKHSTEPAEPTHAPKHPVRRRRAQNN